MKCYRERLSKYEFSGRVDISYNVSALIHLYVHLHLGGAFSKNPHGNIIRFIEARIK